MQYRRVLDSGACYFFTLTLEDRNKEYLTQYIDLLRSAYSKVIKRYPVETIAIVIMPDHLHALWQLPENDSGYALRWRLIKSNFSRSLPIDEFRSKSRIAKSERGIWQRRYWEHKIRDDNDLQNHINYIHYNPVKHKYVTRAVDWPYSSFHKYVNSGTSSVDWGIDAVNISVDAE